jgi:uncharacterized protein YggU (UPF0235/DUF167 family)
MDEYRKIFVPLTDQSFNFSIKVKTGAKANSLDGIICIEATHYLKLTIKAIPEQNKANKAIIDFLSCRWSVPKKTISIVQGKSSNYKVLNIKINSLKEEMLT